MDVAVIALRHPRPDVPRMAVETDALAHRRAPAMLHGTLCHIHIIRRQPARATRGRVHTLRSAEQICRDIILQGARHSRHGEGCRHADNNAADNGSAAHAG